MAVSAWFTSSWRSRASRRRSSSWARIASVPERRRSSSIRWSRPLKERDSLSISSTGSWSGRWWLDGSAGSMPSIRLISRSSGANRRWSIHRFTHSVSTIASARIRNVQRWSETVRSRPAARLAANSVSATSTTFAATTWPMRESSRRVIEGLSMCRNTVRGEKWGLHPISARTAKDETLGEASSRWNLPRASAQFRSGSSAGASERAPRLSSGGPRVPVEPRYPF